MVVSGGGCGFIDTTMKSTARYHLQSLRGETTSSHGIITRCNEHTFFQDPAYIGKVNAECKAAPYCGSLDISKTVTNKSCYLCMPYW